MTENKSSASRRKLLKSIAAGSGAIVAGKSLPENWTRPVVDSVILPAHAQTSQPPAPPPCAYTLTQIVRDQAGAPVPSGGTYLPQPFTIDLAVTPNPGAGVPITWVLLYNGVLATTGSFPTDANGEILGIGYTFGGAGPGGVEVVTWNLDAPNDCATDTWTGTVAAQTPPLSTPAGGFGIFAP